MTKMKPQVMVLGTFHFQGSSDLVQVENGQLTSEEKQQEILEVVENISKFQPTKVAVEVEKKKNNRLNENYQAYLNESFELSLNEVHQLGFRISKQMELENIYGIDWMENSGNRGIDEVFKWAKQKQPSLYSSIMEEYLSKLEVNFEGLTVLETLKRLNNKENPAKEQQAYMQIARIGTNYEYIGIDWLRWWYQRNLIIYKNLLDLADGKEDKILLIIGSGHLYLVNQFLSESGEVEIIEPNDYL